VERAEKSNAIEDSHGAGHKSHAGARSLREEFLTPLGLSANALAMALGVPATRIHEIAKERRGVKTLPTRKDILRKIVPRETVPA
jgi:hypothetical protein